MQLRHAFSRIGIAVDAGRLAAEVDALGEGVWRPHPEGMPGNSSLCLLSTNGDPNDDGVRGPMLPTPHLDACPYASRVPAALDAPIGRTRYMRIEGNGEARTHCDTNYYWQERLRVHVPVRTTPDVRFYCGDDVVHMAPDEVWVFDTWRTHRVVNPAGAPRIHLVTDTVGSPALWELIDRSADSGIGVLKTVEPGPAVTLVTESVNHATVMSPWELRALTAEVLAAVAEPDAAAGRSLEAELVRLHRRWRAGWAQFGDDSAGWPTFARWRDEFRARIHDFDGRVLLRNGLDAAEVLRQLVVRPALAPHTAHDAPTSGNGHRAAPISTPARAAGSRPARAVDRLVRPVFIVSPPRSGSSLLFETLAQAADLHTIGGESHQVIESVPALRPSARGWASNRLEAADAADDVVATLAGMFLADAHDRDGSPPDDHAPVRLLEKTPKNALRVPFLAAAFPDASFVYLYRDPRETISSMLDAWRSGRFVTYRDLPGWGGPPWSLLLTPGWRDVIGRPLVEVVAAQWSTTTTMLLDDLAALDPDRWCVASYDRLVASPQEEAERLCAFIGVDFDRRLPDQLPPSRHTLTSPSPEKWRRNAGELVNVMPGVTPVAERARAVFAQAPATKPPWRRSGADAAPPPAPALPAPSIPGGRDTRLATETGGGEEASPFRSVHTGGFARVLHQMRSSIAVSTYQSGRVILLRSDGDRVNTHLRSFKSPMGMARTRGLLSIATLRGIWEYHEQPALSERADPSGRTDTCFVPRRHLVTGDIRTHEIAYVGGELWAVNTRFSCLATFDGIHSFVPRWRPPFVSALSADDRCHLNGMALSDGRVRYVTAHGPSDEANGWRDGKVGGGIVIDVDTGDTVASGFSMPHSPRLVKGRLWLCDSGQGRLISVDPASGEVEVVAELPGFTRGLAIVGPVAFVGLSQVREHVFADLPLGDRLVERQCGIWAVDITSGATLGYIRFDGAVQEIFDVQVLRGTTYPELVEPDAELVSVAIQLPKDALLDVPA